MLNGRTRRKGSLVWEKTTKLAHLLNDFPRDRAAPIDSRDFSSETRIAGDHDRLDRKIAILDDFRFPLKLEPGRAGIFVCPGQGRRHSLDLIRLVSQYSQMLRSVTLYYHNVC